MVTLQACGIFDREIASTELAFLCLFLCTQAFVIHRKTRINTSFRLCVNRQKNAVKKVILAGPQSRHFNTCNLQLEVRVYKDL